MADIALPIVQIDKAGDERAVECQHLVKSIQNFGFCLVDGAGSLCSYRPDHALDLADWFFNLDNQTKMSLATKVFVKENKNVYRGYFPVKPGNLSYKEGYEAGEETQQQTDNPLLEPTPFPHVEGREDECSWFKEGYTQVRRSLSTVADTLMEMIAEAGGERKDYFHPMFRAGTPLSTHRIIRYPVRSEGDTPPHAVLEDGRIISTGAHADSGFLTILETFGQPGLELQINGAWRPVPPSPNLLIVNIGEQLARMSCGKFKATIHRVVDIGRDRISMPFFHEPFCDSNMNSTIPKSLLGDDVLPDNQYIPFASFLLKKLVIYAEYSSLQENLPAWMRDKYLNQQTISCWAKQTQQIIDGT